MVSLPMMVTQKSGLSGKIDQQNVESVEKMSLEIREIVIDLKQREITVFNEAGEKLTFPLTASGGTILKYTKVSPGGHLVQALTRMLEDNRADFR